MKQLQHAPSIGRNSELNDVTYGHYVELGLHNYIEDSVIGDYSYTCEYCFIQHSVIGKFSNIAAMVRIGTTQHPYERPTLHHFTYRPYLYGFSDTAEEAFFNARQDNVTTLGHDTWIGHGAIIQAGVTIGNGAIVGSGSVVTKDVEPYTIVGGVPARVIKRRFTEQVATELEAIAWWDWSHEQLAQRLADFSLPVEAFIDKYKGGQ